MSRCDVCNDMVAEHKLRHYVQGHICKRCDERIREMETPKTMCNRCQG